MYCPRCTPRFYAIDAPKYTGAPLTFAASMSQHTITLKRVFPAPIDVVFSALADHEHFGSIWSGQTSRIREGENEPNGRGSVRQIRQGWVRFEETTITHEPPHLIEYTITRGTPLKNHLGRIELSAGADGTHMNYVIRFECPIPFLGRKIAHDIERDFHSGIRAFAASLQTTAA